MNPAQPKMRRVGLAGSGTMTFERVLTLVEEKKLLTIIQSRVGLFLCLPNCSNSNELRQINDTKLHFKIQKKAAFCEPIFPQKKLGSLLPLIQY